VTFEFVTEEVLAGYGGASTGKRFGPFLTGETLQGMRIEHVVSPQAREGNQPPLIFVRLKDGALLAAEWGTRGPPPSAPGGPFLLFFGFAALSFCGLMIWAARGLSGPMADLAASASRFGEGSTKPVPVREYGPKEVRAAAQAFNRMQLRINEFLDKRTRMLAAISHDLRTPLTRLRLRLDLLEEGDIRDRSLRDLQLMEQHVDSALTFLRDGESSEPVQRIDVPSFLQSIADQYEDTGEPLRLSFSANLSVMVRSGELGRALCNLIDNANHYASGVEIHSYREGEQAVVDVIDHGPGIAEADRARLLEPFERGDAARQLRDGTGFGLGLATAKAIVEAASGTLELTETVGGGLTVRLRLPLATSRP
jgi:signal transduction histidine kinase